MLENNIDSSRLWNLYETGGAGGHDINGNSTTQRYMSRQGIQHVAYPSLLLWVELHWYVSLVLMDDQDHLCLYFKVLDYLMVKYNQMEKSKLKHTLLIYRETR